jgi:hypothetical protein
VVGKKAFQDSTKGFQIQVVSSKHVCATTGNRVGYGLRGNSVPDTTFPNSQNSNNGLIKAVIALSKVCRSMQRNLQPKRQELELQPSTFEGWWSSVITITLPKDPQHHVRVAGLIGHTVVSTVAKIEMR